MTSTHRFEISVSPSHEFHEYSEKIFLVKTIFMVINDSGLWVIRCTRWKIPFKLFNFLTWIRVTRFDGKNLLKQKQIYSQVSKFACRVLDKNHTNLPVIVLYSSGLPNSICDYGLTMDTTCSIKNFEVSKDISYSIMKFLSHSSKKNVIRM